MNNKIIVKDTHGVSYKSNGAILFVYKSMRKNAKCELISINHLISKNADKKISDESIKNQFIEVLEKVLYISAQYNYSLVLKSFVDIFKDTEFLNANKDIALSTEYNFYRLEKQKFASFEQSINFIYSVFCLVYPYNKLDLKELYNSPSIKYFINKYYSKGVM